MLRLRSCYRSIDQLLWRVVPVRRSSVQARSRASASWMLNGSILARSFLLIPAVIRGDGAKLVLQSGGRWMGNSWIQPHVGP